jgi:hypothetical protein
MCSSPGMGKSTRHSIPALRCPNCQRADLVSRQLRGCAYALPSTPLSLSLVTHGSKWTRDVPRFVTSAPMPAPTHNLEADATPKAEKETPRNVPWEPLRYINLTAWSNTYATLNLTAERSTPEPPTTTCRKAGNGAARFFFPDRKKFLLLGLSHP